MHINDKNAAIFIKRNGLQHANSINDRGNEILLRFQKLMYLFIKSSLRIYKQLPNPFLAFRKWKSESTFRMSRNLSPSTIHTISMTACDTQKTYACQAAMPPLKCLEFSHMHVKAQESVIRMLETNHIIP